MGDLTKIETLLSVAVFAIPIAVFVTLVILLIRRRRRSAMPPPGQEARAPDRARPEAAPVAQPTVTQPPTVEVKGVPEIVKRIDAAIAAGQNSALAALYLDLAHGYEKLGNVEARLSALRSAAGCGSLHGPRSCHAAARLELAEIAYAAGDLTSACEQWQLARIAFLEDDQTEQFARVEKRMRENGCPTDWVLTDF